MPFTECDFCTGSRWLADNKDLGPCACVTPENLMLANEEIAELDDEGLDDEGLDARAGEILEHLQRYLSRQGINPAAVRFDDDDLDKAMDLLTSWR